MAIQLSHSCTNCSALSNSMICNVHKVKVGASYTCESFNSKIDFNKAKDCSSCSRYSQASCAQPEKAAAGMLCNSWAPAEVH